VGLALLWDRHGHAERAREWFQGCDDEQFLFCRFMQITVLRAYLVAFASAAGLKLVTFDLDRALESRPVEMLLL